MSSPFDTRERHGGANGSTESARAHETVAHGRAHLDHQRRIATAYVHRDNLRVMRHDPKRTT